MITLLPLPTLDKCGICESFGLLAFRDRDLSIAFGRCCLDEMLAVERALNGAGMREPKPTDKTPNH